MPKSKTPEVRIMQALREMEPAKRDVVLALARDEFAPKPTKSRKPGPEVTKKIAKKVEASLNNA